MPKPLHILDLDIENRPLSYWIPDRPTAEITAIAAGFAGCKKREIRCYLLGPLTVPEILKRFVKLYNQADAVTGHYITRHDLPIISGALMENGMPPLEPKLAIDTKVQLRKKADIPATQEHLSDMMGVTAIKYHMTQARWREANKLTPEGIAFTRKRVVDDVWQHMQLRLALAERDLLNPPKVWRP